jgi:group II intron reverse transcriptase/maturase
MQDARVYLGLVRERGTKGLPLQRVSRQLYNRELYLIAYGKIYRNNGAMTRGTTGETVDSMSLAKIDAIIDALRQERYRWKPVRRVYIPKRNSTKKRALGLPTWSDKLLQEVIRLILDAYFEPSFSDHSHGFRPQRGCHTALKDIYESWAGVTWFIEGDISACFDSLSHDIVLDTLAEQIQDGRFLRLIRELLKAGYLEEWQWNRTLSGAPQGSIIGPIVANIYLSKLDTFVEQTLVPAYTRGDRRRANPPYSRIDTTMQRKRRQGKMEEVKRLERQRRALPSVDPDDPNYRRLRYCRYADDWLVGFIGPKEEAEEIKRRIGMFLNEQLKLELSKTKTLITHARTEKARFLGYEISTFQRTDARERTYYKRRVLNGKAAKLKLSVHKVYEKYRATLLVDGHSYKGLQTVIDRGEEKKPLIAQGGGIPLRRRMELPLNDTPYPYWDARTELVQRLLADTCELCGSHTAIEVHHIRALKDLKQYGRTEKPAWVKTMAARHRKTLVVCCSCHKDIHHGRPLKTTPHLE